MVSCQHPYRLVPQEGKALPAPFGIMRYSPGSWGAYMRHLGVDQPQPGNRHTQRVERKRLTLRTRITRLTP